MKTKNMTTLHLRKSIGRSPLGLGFLLIGLALAWFALSPPAQAVTPPPDGGYPGFNTAEGNFALTILTTGYANTAMGVSALQSNTIEGQNSAYGFAALQRNLGEANTAIGANALQSNRETDFNTACGFAALQNNTTGFSNIALGATAGQNLTTGSNNIDIGNAGVAGESSTIRIGTVGTHANTFIAGISGATVARGVGVTINSGGHL